MIYHASSFGSRRKSIAADTGGGCELVIKSRKMICVAQLRLPDDGCGSPKTRIIS